MLQTHRSNHRNRIVTITMRIPCLTILTVGHSDHDLDTFRGLLVEHGVTSLVDVRSVPYSRFRPHFNREPIKVAAAQADIRYTYYGDDLGGRPDHSNCYDENGQVCYRLVANTEKFRRGLNRIISEAARYRIALMCSEEDPIRCHRTLLIAHELTTQGIAVSHIRASGKLLDSNGIESHESVIDRLIGKFNLYQGELGFSDCDQLITQTQDRNIVEEAIERQRQAIAFVDARLARSTRRKSMTVSTIGFTSKSAEQFFGLLEQSGSRRVVDVRLNNTSQLAGFSKRDDLAYLLREICGMTYVHMAELAPTRDMLSDYRKGHIDWETYESRFMELMRERRIEDTVPKEVIDGSCLLCSEHESHRCHRRLVAEYLRERWGDLQIEHLGLDG